MSDGDAAHAGDPDYEHDQVSGAADWTHVRRGPNPNGTLDPDADAADAPYESHAESPYGG